MQNNMSIKIMWKYEKYKKIEIVFSLMAWSPVINIFEKKHICPNRQNLAIYPAYFCI